MPTCSSRWDRVFRFFTSPGEPVPADPGVPVPADPGVPVPADPGVPVPADPGVPVPADSGVPVPADPGEPVPAGELASTALPGEGDADLPPDGIEGRGPWVPALLGPYLERQLAELSGAAIRCSVEPDPGRGDDARAARRRQAELAVERMFGRRVVVTHRGDGKPGVAGNGVGISASHGAALTLAVAGPGRVCCGVETIHERTPGGWRGLLAAQFPLAELIQRERGEELPLAATRVWGAVECLRKLGWVLTGPVTLAEGGAAGWVLLQAGTVKIATFCTFLRDQPEPVIFTVLFEKDKNA